MSSGFISETEVLEQRRRRQEEWEKVRTEDQPQEAPEEPYDTRPLYQRLEEQRLKKEAEYEEAHKLKNMIRGLDDDEVGFLDLVERSKAKAAQQISIEEQKEMQEFRERVSNLAESEELTRLRAQLAPARTAPAQNANTQKNKLQGIIVRKRKASEMEDEKQKGAPSAKVNGVVTTNADSPTSVSTTPAAGATTAPTMGATTAPASAATMAPLCGALVMAGVLPGLGHYSSHSDSSSDTDSSDDELDDDKCCKRDILGRRPEQSGDKTKTETKS